MPTIIKRYPNASFPGTLILDLEPPVEYPEGSLLGAYRYKRSFDMSKSPRAGVWPAASLSSGDAPVFDSVSVSATAASIVLPGTALPSTGDITIGALVAQERPGGGAGTQFFMGASDGSSNRIVLQRTTSNNFAMQVGGVTAGIAGTAGLWEVVFGTYNRATGALTIRNPRTGATATNTQPTANAPTGSVRLTGPVPSSYSGSVRLAWGVAYNRLLTESEMDLLYASVRDSVAVSGLEVGV